MHKKKKYSNKNKFPSLGSKLDSAEKIRHYYLKIISYMPNNVYWLDRNCITQGCNNNILKLLDLKELHEFVGINYDQMAQLAGWTEGQAQSFERDDREVMETGLGKFNKDGNICS
jgi:two-component system aerobic respiration control sensor histidine kinase ArcB